MHCCSCTASAEAACPSTTWRHVTARWSWANHGHFGMACLPQVGADPGEMKRCAKWKKALTWCKCCWWNVLQAQSTVRFYEIATLWIAAVLSWCRHCNQMLASPPTYSVVLLQLPWAGSSWLSVVPGEAMSRKQSPWLAFQAASRAFLSAIQASLAADQSFASLLVCYPGHQAPAAACPVCTQQQNVTTVLKMTRPGKGCRQQGTGFNAY